MGTSNLDKASVSIKFKTDASGWSWEALALIGSHVVNLGALMPHDPCQPLVSKF